MSRKRIVEREQRRELQVCYVCGGKIKGEPVYIAASAKYPAGLHRHIRCAPGSARWLQSYASKESELRDFYINEGGGDNGTRDTDEAGSAEAGST